VCLDFAERRGPRTLPTLARPAAAAGEDWMAAVDEPVWIEPLPDARLVAKEGVALAFIAVLSRLPPRQRAALLLFDVLGFHAGEVAELLGLSVAAANSALQRARESVTAEPTARRAPPEIERGLLERYLRAWEEADVRALVSLLAGDARLSMPPFPLWYQGAEAIGAALAGMVLPPAARGRFRGVTTSANGEPAVAVYERDPGGRFVPLAVHVLRIEEGRIAEITAFMGPGAFRGFELPAEM
jgi:RNA polymerase sigma-70 factor (ECF subfamily)